MHSVCQHTRLLLDMLPQSQVQAAQAVTHMPWNQGFGARTLATLTSDLLTDTCQILMVKNCMFE